MDALVVESVAGPQVYTLQGLDAESNRFRGEMLAQVSDAVIAVDGEDRIIYLNAAAERLYGVTASDGARTNAVDRSTSRGGCIPTTKPPRRPPCASAANGAAKTSMSGTTAAS